MASSSNKQDLAIELFTIINTKDINRLKSMEFQEMCYDCVSWSVNNADVRKVVMDIIIENGWKDKYIELMSDSEKNVKLGVVNVELTDWVMVSRNIKKGGINRPDWLPTFPEEEYISIFTIDGKEVPMFGFDLNNIEIGLLKDGYHFVRYNDPQQTELVYFKEPIDHNLSAISTMLRRLLSIFEKNTKK